MAKITVHPHMVKASLTFSNFSYIAKIAIALGFHRLRGKALFLERSIFRDSPIVSDRGNGTFFVRLYHSTVCVFRSNKVTKAQINVHGFQKICYTSLKCE